MNIKDYDSLILEFRECGDFQAKQKRIEYTESRGDEDVLANFKATAKTFDVDTLTDAQLDQIQGLGDRRHCGVMRAFPVAAKREREVSAPAKEKESTRKARRCARMSTR